MKPLEQTYKGNFFAKRNKLSWRAPIVCDAIENVFDLNRKRKDKILDVGCAIGDYVKEFKKRGYISCGWEGSAEARKYACTKISIVDIREPLEKQFGVFWDACMSLEVAEHIEPEYAQTFVKNLCMLSDKILITAAPPGQGGHGHYNCQEKSYWESLFQEEGFFRSIAKEEIFKNTLTPFLHRKEMSVYARNALVFLRFGE